MVDYWIHGTISQSKIWTCAHGPNIIAAHKTPKASKIPLQQQNDFLEWLSIGFAKPQINLDMMHTTFKIIFACSSQNFERVENKISLERMIDSIEKFAQTWWTKKFCCLPLGVCTTRRDKQTSLFQSEICSKNEWRICSLWFQTQSQNWTGHMHTTLNSSQLKAKLHIICTHKPIL